MRAPGESLDQVYVLRHTFQINEPLQEELSKLVTTSTKGSRRFVFNGTDERVLEVSDSRSQDFDIQMHEADAYLQLKANTPLLLEGEIRARGYVVRGQGMVALRLIMTPQNTAEYTSIRESLYLVEAGRPAYTPGHEQGELYTTIPAENLLPIKEVQARLRDLNYALGDTAMRQLYQVTPSPRHVGIAVPRISRESSVNLDDESEADEYTESRAS